MFKNLLTILLFCFSIVGFAQKSENFIDTINNFCNRILSAKDDTQKEIINDSLIYCLMKHLEKPSSFNEKYDGFNYISVLKSDDGKLNVFTWNLFFEKGKYKYFGFLQYKNKKQYVYFLNDKKFSYDNEEEDEDENVKQYLYKTNTEWFGALYYDIITKKYQSKTYYTLLGWDGVNHKISRKIVEVLQFAKRDLPIFGGRVFKRDNIVAQRLIFDFSNKVSMILRYNPKIDMIIFDHLTPATEKFVNINDYYGPDYSYDALFFQNGQWIYKPNIDANYAIPYQKNKKINNMKKQSFSKNF